MAEEKQLIWQETRQQHSRESPSVMVGNQNFKRNMNEFQPMLLKGIWNRVIYECILGSQYSIRYTGHSSQFNPHGSLLQDVFYIPDITKSTAYTWFSTYYTPS